ncbi:hypothetical protein [Novosphingopyxis sp. YJ-S2-01]|uniref:hypothetical protein n=1 Tax=Novosphingopyxis sp. YJ-S2-01 TaxID=2794021 RepID=UPI0018DEABA4|nr:hypothetical protein [Novosphingopyxis sp. YJ-S2-01]MBH9537541.1 hypothetical protein [Novosphingopyxis sp. YJ-S2-01]
MLTTIMRATGLSKLSVGLIAAAVVIIAVGLIYALSARSQDMRVSEGVERGKAIQEAASGAEQAKRTRRANKASAEVTTDPTSREVQCDPYNRSRPAECDQ